MRTLSQPAVMQRAAVAALLTAGASYPRLMHWSERSHALGFLLALLILVSFVMWAFVFAWLPKHGRIELFPGGCAGRTWLLATLGGLAGGGLLRLWFDPSLRPLLPQDYPDTLAAWTATTLFHLAFVQLFLTFAPLAFFVRLFGDRLVAATLTVLFSLCLLVVQAGSAEVALSGRLVGGMVAFRILAGALGMYLLFRGGLLPGWWLSFLLQLRLLVEAVGSE